MLPRFLLLPAGLATLVTLVSAQLPYNPTRIIPAQDGSVAYVISRRPSSSQFALSVLDVSDQLNATSPKVQLFDSLPFLSKTTSQAFIPIHDDQGITVLAGDCSDDSKDIELWRFTTGNGTENGTWSTLELSTSDASLGARYLSAGFAFSPTDSDDDVSLYVFGGMCPTEASTNATSWVTDATYSNTMLTLSPDSTSGSSSPYQLSLTGSRAPPIAEAGLTITPLTPTYSNTSDTSVSQQQNFVLLGGHTQSAFINMSQLALFALPQESWAFVGVSQPSGSGSSKLRYRDSTTVEPRSGHTAVLTEDGSRIVVLGGWVGDISTPAQPQLVILEVGEGYGGDGDWAWTIPTTTSNPFSSGGGIYGHGAALLPGGVMMVSGGYSISSSGSTKKRAVSEDILFLNTTALAWTTTYTNPYPSGTSSGSVSGDASPSGLKSSEKAGLGAGLGLGLAAAAGVSIVWLLYSRKLREKRAVREKELREQALGSRFHSPTPPDQDEKGLPSFRTASWGAMQERQIESNGDPFPWAPVVAPDQTGTLRIPLERGDSDYSRYAERTGVQVEVPSPTRGLRKGLSTRAPLGVGLFNQLPPPPVPGAVFRIDEEDEGSQAGSARRGKIPTFDNDQETNNPFKDPPATVEDAASQRKKEVDGWVEDWQSAAETMTLSRSTSQAYSRTYSNLSQFRPHAGPGDASGRGSPEKSDRTGSNLSESSALTTSSFQRSMVGTLSRNISQRSASAGYAGYALFAGAAAAMGRVSNSRQGQLESGTSGGLARAPSNRSVSLNTDSAGHARGQDRPEWYSSVRNPFAPQRPGENQALLHGNHQQPGSEDRHYTTLGEAPRKDKYVRSGSMTGSSRRAMNLLGSVKRAFTGTGNVDVPNKVSTGENNSSSHSSPTKYSGQPDMTETNPNRKISADTFFWRGRRGAKDWDEDAPEHGNVGGSSGIHRKPVPGPVLVDDHEGLEEDEDWDVETAVQKRVVQVMFTVPKEKLRVVNADSLSLLSSNRSEADHEEDKERDAIKRMSSLKEGDEDPYDLDDPTTKWKGKERED